MDIGGLLLYLLRFKPISNDICTGSFSFNKQVKYFKDEWNVCEFSQFKDFIGKYIDKFLNFE